ncbi:uncharacterized protein C17orf50 homolog [Neopsephotus bourkii]|uniref:uncharacterized protein C17orf50 homolog n=1 Tax=Neopsephotus bourkii TaxID=309878 RepID=UPI002AA52CE1|nr:uncharacterized protein C17orf50 homolog [Neopsephotus bourkii]
MTDKMSWHKEKKELTEENTGDGKHSRRKRERLFKKRFSGLSLFSGSPKNKLPQGRSQLHEDKRRCLHRKGSKKLKAAREEICSLRQPHSGKMCPKCEILVCPKCETLHSERSFIAHSLLDHYDTGDAACRKSSTQR